MSSKPGALTIAGKELAAYVNSPIAAIFIFVFVVLNCSLFMASFFLLGLADMRGFFSFLPVTLGVFIPAVTMRSWAEENRSSTMELLLTFPIKPHGLVMGKFLASLFFYIVALAATLPIPIMLFVLGTPDPGPIVGGYLGSILVGAFFLAVGLFISGLCKDQIVAFILSMLACFGLLIVGNQFIATTVDGWVSGLGSFLDSYVGVISHFASFERGVLDSGDVLYFLLGAGLFLMLNGFWIEGRMRPKQKQIFGTAAVISLAIFVVANVFLGDLGLGRVDLTEGKLYTISPVSKRILGGLKAPVNVKYYVSPKEKMPTAFKNLEQDVVDKLDEFRILSGGKLQFQVVHMEASNMMNEEEGGEESLEKSLQRKGIRPFQVQSLEADEMGVKLIYSSMTLGYKEKPEEMLPPTLPSNLTELEYQLVSKVYRLTLDKAPLIAVVAPYEEKQLDPVMQQLLAQMGADASQVQYDDAYRLVPLALQYDGYQVERVDLTEESPLPEGADTLVMIEPKDLSEDQEYSVNRFLVEGGSLFLATQKNVFEYRPSGRGAIGVSRLSVNPSLGGLLETWGLGVKDEVLLDESHDVLNIQAGGGFGPFAMNIPVKLPIHIRIMNEGMNPDYSISSRLDPILYMWGSALDLDEEKLKELGLSVKVLLRSSPKSWLIPGDKTQYVPRDMMLSNQSTQQFPLAVLVEGQFPNAMPGVKPDKELNPQPGKLLLVGAQTLFTEDLIQSGGHLDFLKNSVDAMSLDEDIIKIRSKRPMDRTIDRVSAGSKAWWRFFASLMLPLAIVLLGWFRILLRKRGKASYMKALSAATN
ncbi:MAG: Gldg family protein [Candidatus Omnitrophica bacterium]|nr:Gldg family protein [Candidatus Omnitrophota bacterium]